MTADAAGNVDAGIAARPAVAWWDRPAGAIAMLTAVVLARAAWYARQGVDFVLDDWSLAGFRQANGTMSDAFLSSRPGTWAVNTVLFGIADDHPLVLFGLVTVLFLITTVLLYVVATRYLTPGLALAVAACWVLLPNHNTLALWGATMPTLVAVSLTLVGLAWLTTGRWVPATVALVAAVVTYELVAPLCLLLPLVAPGPWQRVPASRPVPWWGRAGAIAGVGLAVAYAAAEPLYDRSIRTPDPVVFWSGHFGTGLLSSADPPAVLRFGLAGLVAAGVIVALVAWVRGDRGRDAGPALVVVGLAIMAASAWVAFTLPMGSHGQNDRLYATSSIGSALIVVGIVRHAWVRTRASSNRAARAAIGVAVATFVAVCLVGQHVSLGSWIRAGDDAVAALAYIEANAPGDPRDSHFVIGPTRIHRNAVSGIQNGDGHWALFLTFGDGGNGTLRIPDSPEGFVPRSDREVLVEWDEIVPDPPPYAPADQ